MTQTKLKVLANNCPKCGKECGPLSQELMDENRTQQKNSYYAGEHTCSAEGCRCTYEKFYYYTPNGDAIRVECRQDPEDSLDIPTELVGCYHCGKNFEVNPSDAHSYEYEGKGVFSSVEIQAMCDHCGETIDVCGTIKDEIFYCTT